MQPGEVRRGAGIRADGGGLLAVSVAVALAAAALFGYMASRRPGLETLWGDEGTYIAMTASLARDLDLRFEEADRDWALERRPGQGVAVILQRTPGGPTYSKPLLYPLVAAPAFRLLGEPGLLLVNALALAVGLYLAWLYLRRLGSSGHTTLTLVLFAGAGILLPYLAWRMSESLQVALAMAGTALACGVLRGGAGSGDGRRQDLLDHRWAPLLGGFLLGLLVMMRYSNAALVGGALLAVALYRRWSRAGRIALGTAVAVLLMLGLNQLMLGTTNPYTAQRSSFNAAIGYPLGDTPATAPSADESAEPASRFEARPATHRVGLQMHSATLYSTLYFMVGRHTGLLAYLPMALLLIGVIVVGRDRAGLGLLLGALVLAVFTLLYTPHNYFGGSTFLGNRYFLVAYPALLFGLYRLPSVRSLAVVAAIALAFGISAAVSVRNSHGLTSTSQSHAAAGLFRLLPYESTAIAIQGHPRRYWSRDYVRFVDPWADAKRSHFVLHAGRPRTEVMIASHRPRERMLFLARGRDGTESLLWADWRAGGSFRLGPDSLPRPMELVVEPSEPWRRHRLWFQNQETYDARLLRFGLEGRETSTAEIYYLGSGEQLEQGFERQVVEVVAPNEGIVGESVEVRLRIRNTSRLAWRRDSVLPIAIGYRLELPDGLAAQDRRLLPDDVAPGEEIAVDVEVRWPQEPADYRLVIDLYLHPVHWFADKVGEPLLDRQVRVSG